MRFMRQQQCRKKINSNSSKLQVQLDFIPEIEVLYNLRYGILKWEKKRSLKQHMKYFNSWSKILLDHPVLQYNTWERNRFPEVASATEDWSRAWRPGVNFCSVRCPHRLPSLTWGPETRTVSCVGWELEKCEIAGASEYTILTKHCAQVS